MADVVVAPTGAGPAETGLSQAKKLLELAGSAAAALSIVASALSYFGALSAQTEALFFGLDARIYGYSTQDLITRSVAPMLGPLALAFLGVLLVIWANDALGDHRGAPSRLLSVRWQAGALAGGIVLMATGAAWQLRYGARHSYWSPPMLIVGALLTGTARGMLTLRRTAGGRGRTARAARRRPVTPMQALDPGTKLVLAFVVLFAVFGFTAKHAQATAWDRAQAIASNVEVQPQVTVFAEQPLALTGNGVACFEIRGSRYTRRYLGLRQLFHGNGYYVLMPAGLDAANIVTYVIPEDDTLRVQYDATRTGSGSTPARVESPAGVIC